MEGLTACSVGGRSLLLRLPSSPSRRRNTGRQSLFLTSSSSFCCRSRSVTVSASSSRDGPELDKWEQMELKFGRLLGEDPKLTLAKIMARKSNPDVSYLDVEKSFTKNKGKLDEYVINAPKDLNVEAQPSSSSSLRKPLHKDAKNVMKGEKIHLERPLMIEGIKATRPTGKPASVEKQASQVTGDTISKSGASDISLRKPSVPQDDDTEFDFKLKVKPNLILKMKRSSDEMTSNVSLLKKPEAMQISTNCDQVMSSKGSVESTFVELRTLDHDSNLLNACKMSTDEMAIFDKEETTDELHQLILDGHAVDSVVSDIESSAKVQQNYVHGSAISDMGMENDVVEHINGNNDHIPGLQPHDLTGAEALGNQASSLSLNHDVDASGDKSNQAALLYKPQRQGLLKKGISHPTKEENVVLDDRSYDYTSGLETVTSAGQEELEESDWKKTESLLYSGERTEVDLISCSSRGFVVSFGSLIGFLPYQNLGSKWKFFAFESWLRKNGLDPNLFRQNLSILGRYDVNSESSSLESTKSQESNDNDAMLQSQRNFKDLLKAYDQEKANYLSSFIGQRIRVSVILVDRKSKKLMFSGRRKENEELSEKKRSLMGRLSIGDVVKCCITKITYFGIFVEVEGVPALIHQSEVSWDATLDPSSYYKIGQIVEAKVHQLDFALERIVLSLKDVTPDPLTETLESVFGDQTSLVGNLEATQIDVEWADVELLIKELQKIDGVSNVYKGRYFVSPGLAPTFQVYMASMFDNKYKVLARFENKVQEVVVESSLNKEQMKAAILTCTSRVG